MSSDALLLVDVCPSLKVLLVKLSSDDGQLWLAALKNMLRRENPWAAVLGKSREICLPANTENFLAQTFFKSRQGLAISGGFMTLVLSATSETSERPPTIWTSIDLVHEAVDVQIRNQLPRAHVYGDINGFCLHLSGMITRQANGTTGALSNTQLNENLFYVIVGQRMIVINVYWAETDREWTLDAHLLSDHKWPVGSRVFSAVATT